LLYEFSKWYTILAIPFETKIPAMSERSWSYETLPYQNHKRKSASMERDPLAILPGMRNDAVRQITNIPVFTNSKTASNSRVL